MAEIRQFEETYQWNITRLADALGLHRDTVRKRLKEAGVVPAKTQGSTNLYALKDAAPALFSDRLHGDSVTPDQMEPQDRKAWYQSERERIKLEMELREVVLPTMQN